MDLIINLEIISTSIWLNYIRIFAMRQKTEKQTPQHRLAIMIKMNTGSFLI